MIKNVDFKEVILVKTSISRSTLLVHFTHVKISDTKGRLLLNLRFTYMAAFEQTNARIPGSKEYKIQIHLSCENLLSESENDSYFIKVNLKDGDVKKVSFPSCSSSKVSCV